MFLRLSRLNVLILFRFDAPKTMKAACLLKSSGTLEVLTLKLRLMLELKLVNETRVFQMQSEAQEIGRMLGGWLKSVQSM